MLKTWKIDPGSRSRAETMPKSHRLVSGPRFLYQPNFRKIGPQPFWVLLFARLAFDTPVTAVARSCNYHAQAIRHIRHLLTTELAQTLASGSVKNWLLQRCAPWCSNQQHPKASTCAVQCRSDRSSGAKAITHQITTPPAAVAAGPTADHVQVGRSGV